jgi:hypothetical protein
MIFEKSTNDFIPERGIVSDFVQSRAKNRIQAFEFDTSIVDGKVPIDVQLCPVASGLPGGELALHGIEVGQTALQISYSSWSTP